MEIRATSRTRFRFEGLAIWQRGRDLAVELHRVAEELERRSLYRYAEQLRGAALSVPNNIAEGSGSGSVKEFRQFLNIAHRSLFENASMLLVFEAMGLWAPGRINNLLGECDEVSRMVTSFSRSVGKA
jgi:four helix bundle protein